jgi:hypothetical protein
VPVPAWLLNRDAWVLLGFGVLIIAARGPLIAAQKPEIGPASLRNQRVAQYGTWIAGLGLVVLGLLFFVVRR